jgi:dynamin family protein/uncharacterized protein DUF6861
MTSGNTAGATAGRPRSFDELRDAVVALFSRLDTLAAAYANQAPLAAQRAAAARDRLTRGQLMTAVCGEFKRGKSTLLTALLDEPRNRPRLFPADTLPATNSVTTIRWGAQERILVTVELPNGTPQTTVITREQIADYATEAGNPNNARKVVLIEIESPNPKLASGLAFADTPGVGGVFTAHTAVTLAFLPSADALLFVTDVEKPLAGTELAFLQQAIGAARMTNDVRSLVCVMTKIDQTTDYSGLLAENRAKLAGLTGLPEDEVVLIPVSSWQKLEYLDDSDPVTLAQSNFPALEDALWAALGSRRTRVLLGDALRAAREWTQAILTPIEAAAQSARDKTGKVLDDLESQARNRDDYLKQLDKDSKSWEADLNAELRTASDTLVQLAQNEIERIWSRFNGQYVYDTALLEEPERLTDRLGADFTALLGGLLRLVRREVTAAVERFSVAKGLTLQAPDISDLPDLPSPDLPRDVSGVGKGKRGEGVVIARYTAASIGIGSATGGVIGAVLGSVLLPGAGTVGGAVVGAQIGSAISAAVGGWLGFRSSAKMVKTRQEDARRTELIRVFGPAKGAQERYVRSLLTVAFDGIRPAAVAELKSRIKQERETTENVLRRLEAARKAAESGRAADEAQFAAERAPFDAALADADALEAEAALLGSQGAAPAGAGGQP